MLKFIYTDTGLYLEHLTQPLEEWLSVRVMLSLRAKQPLRIEDCTASFLLPAHLSAIAILKATLEAEGEAITLSRCDADYVEVTLPGTWVSSQPEEAEGVFVAIASERAEFLLSELWQMAQAGASSLKR